MGGGIHNVSQAVGAGYAVSNEAGDLAVVFKLIRVSMLLPVIIIISLVWGKGSSTPYPNVRSKLRASTPPFLIVFCLLALLSCLNIIPDLAKNAGNISAHWALIISLVAIGIKTDITVSHESWCKTPYNHDFDNNIHGRNASYWGVNNNLIQSQ